MCGVDFVAVLRLPVILVTKKLKFLKMEIFIFVSHGLQFNNSSLDDDTEILITYLETLLSVDIATQRNWLN